MHVYYIYVLSHLLCYALILYSSSICIFVMCALHIFSCQINPLYSKIKIFDLIHILVDELLCNIFDYSKEVFTNSSHTVTMQAQKSAPSDMQCKDKFLIQSTVVPYGTSEEEITSSMVGSCLK